MLDRSQTTRRRGGTIAILLLLLVPLLAMVAFGLDLNYVWRAETELQTAADSAAQAGATRLMSYAVKAGQPGVTSTDLSALRVAAGQAVSDKAVAFGQMHRVGDDSLVVNAADIELGYIADPAASPGTTAGQFQTGSSAPFPNSVRATVRRDSSVSKGALPLFFGPVAGTPTASRTATSVATLRGQNVTGFKGSGSKILPLALSLQSYQYLTGAATAPAGVLTDNFTVTTRMDGGPAPPSNVTAGGDGIKEISVYPDPTAPGNFGLLSLTNGKATSSPTYSNWILNGPSAADLLSFGPNGLQAPTTAYGGPGLKMPLTGDFATIIGRPSIAVIVGPPSGNGSNTTYPILGFTGAVIVKVDQVNNSVFIQLCPVIDPNVTLGAGPGSGSTQFIYRGISLSR